MPKLRCLHSHSTREICHFFGSFWTAISTTWDTAGFFMDSNGVSAAGWMFTMRVGETDGYVNSSRKRADMLEVWCKQRCSEYEKRKFIPHCICLISTTVGSTTSWRYC